LKSDNLRRFPAFPIFRFPAANDEALIGPIGPAPWAWTRTEQSKTERIGNSARDKARFGNSKRDADAGHLQQSARFTARLLTPSMGGGWWVVLRVACGSGWMGGVGNGHVIT